MYGKTAPYFVRHLEPTILEIIAKKEKPGGGKYNLYTDGLKIYTTIDYELQTNAVESMQQHMRVLQNEFYRHWGKSNPWGKNNSLVMNTLKKSPYYKSLEKEGLTKEEIEKKINVPVEMHLFN
jgi:penicillin-binding protein 1A